MEEQSLGMIPELYINNELKEAPLRYEANHGKGKFIPCIW